MTVNCDAADLDGRRLNLVLDDTFSGQFDKTKWNQEVSLWGGGVSSYLTINNLICHF